MILVGFEVLAKLGFSMITWNGDPTQEGFFWASGHLNLWCTFQRWWARAPPRSGANK